MSSGLKTFWGSQGEGHSRGNVVEFVLSGKNGTFWQLSMQLCCLLWKHYSL